LRHAFELFQTSFVGSGTLNDKLKAAALDIETGNLNGAAENIRVALETDRGDLNFSVETVHHPKADEELHELRKFLKLAADNNPNIIEYLYVDRLILHESPVWKRIRENRHLFLSKKARWTFSGYAWAQLERIKVHRGYLLSPPDHQPTRAEFGLQEGSEIAKENQNAVLSLPDKWVSEGARDYVRKEKAFNKALMAWRAYKKWETERNPARREMERQYGFDVKHAMHLIRLSRMGVEIIGQGVVNVYRPDRDELRGVLRGEWTYEKLLESVAETDKQLEELYSKSPLRESPDRKRIAELYREICEEHYGIRIEK
jgi:predicted nucleotidyltransferase